MAVTTKVKSLLNQLINPLGLKLETKLTDSLELQRIEKLEQNGYFERPAFPIPQSVQNSGWQAVVSALARYQSELARLEDASMNEVGFTNKNTFYFPPDSDVLYTMVREYRPARIVEIGSGNSTRITRQAIRDGNLSTHVVSIDPMPRSDVQGFADEIRRHPVEKIPAESLAGELRSGDFLFIDSSHMVTVGNDCVYEFLQLLPRIASGVIVHVHDISLPWDYPEAWYRRVPQVKIWNEQYLLQAILNSGDNYEVLWPGYYVQQTNAETFDRWFPARCGRDAHSFWMRRR